MNWTDPVVLIETRDGILCRFPVIVVPGDMEVTYSSKQVPFETPFGIMHSHTIEISFAGQRFHMVMKNRQDGLTEAIDLEDGSPVMLRLPTQI